MADKVSIKDKNSLLMMMVVEQQSIWEEPFHNESRKGIFKLRKHIEGRLFDDSNYLYIIERTLIKRYVN